MDLTVEEKDLCQQFRDRVTDLKITDNFRIMDMNVIRFLRARGMDIDKAEDMFRKYIQWREENDIDNARFLDVAQDLKANFRYQISGINYDGGLVLCANVGEWDPLLGHGRYEEIIKVAYRELESIAHIAKHYILGANRFVKMVAIINLEGLTFTHCTNVDWIRGMITLLKVFEAYYPESLQIGFLINAPWVFSILWSIAKPFISTATHQRIRFLGADRESWKAEISEYVPEDQFPERFGGLLSEDSALVIDEHDKVVRKWGPEDKNMKDDCENDVPRPVDSIELD